MSPLLAHFLALENTLRHQLEPSETDTDGFTMQVHQNFVLLSLMLKGPSASGSDLMGGDETLMCDGDQNRLLSRFKTFYGYSSRILHVS